MRNIIKNILPIAAIVILLFSCSKEVEEPDTYGCLDNDAANYDANVDWADNSCKYLYVTEFEITYHENKSWDDLNPLFSEADLVLQVSLDNLSNVKYVSNTVLDVNSDSIALFTASEQFQLTNTTWYWELYNDDMVPLLETYDYMTGASFNPVTSGNGSYVTSMSSDGTTQIKIYYDVR